MANLSSPGIGSGLNVQDLVSKLGAAERAPLTKLKTDATQTQSKISALAQLRSKMSELQTAATALRNPATWSTMQATSSNDLAVIASSMGVARSGSVSVDVQSIAKAQAVAAGTLFPVGAGWGGGTLRLQLGQWTISPPTFSSSNMGIPVDVTIAAGDTTKQIAEKINAAQSDVKASVLTDSSGGERLFLQGSKPGQANGFELSVLDAQGDPAASNSLTKMTTGLTVGQYASDARVKVDGIEMTSPTNTFSDVAGLNFTVKSVTTSPVTIEASKNQTLSNEAVKTFMEKYNAVNDYLAQLTKYDPTTKTAGLLQGDSTASSLQNSLRSMVSKTFADNNATSLGLTIERGGSLKMDSAKFATAMTNNGDAVRSFFTSTTSSGVADVLRQSMSNALGEGGTLKTKELTYNQFLSRNKAQQDRVEERAVRMEQLYTRQFQTLDSKLTSMQAISAYWTNQANSGNNNF